MNYVPQRRVSQPQYPVAIDRSNPLGRTVTHCIPLDGCNREIVTGATVTYGVGGSTVTDLRGLSLKGAGAGARASVAIDLSPYTKVSVSFWMYWDSFANNDLLAMEYGAHFVTNSGFLLDPNAASTGFDAGVGSPSASLVQSFARPSAAAWHHYVINLDRTTGAADSTTMWIDGKPATLIGDVGVQTNVVDNFGNNLLYIFSRNNSALLGSGRMQNIVLRGGYLMQGTEAKAEYDNPWQIFAPQTRRIWMAAAGGGITVTSDHILPLEFLSCIFGSAVMPLESGVGMGISAQAQFEYLLQAAGDAQPLFEWSAGVARDAAAPVEFRATLNAESRAPIDYAGLLFADGTVPFEALLTTRADHVSPAEWLAMLQADAVVPVEWSGGIQVNADAQIPLEWRGSIAADNTLQLSISQLLAVDHAVPEEFGTGVVRDQAALLEWLASIGADALLPLSTIAVIQGDQVIMAEWGGTAAFVSGNLNVFHLDARGTVWHLDARGTVWHLDARGTVWHVTHH